MKGIKEEQLSENLNNDQNKTAGTEEMRTERSEAEPREAGTPTWMSTQEASLEAVLSGVDSTMQDWPRVALGAVLSRWRQMPRYGWPKVCAFFCEKFKTQISLPLFKKRAQQILIGDSGRLTRTRRYCEEKGSKRIKTVTEIISAATTREAALFNSVKAKFLSLQEEFKEQRVTEARMTRKLSVDQVNEEVLSAINKVVGAILRSSPPNNITEIAKVLQVAQACYQEITTKPRVPSEWMKNIEAKIKKHEDSIETIKKAQAKGATAAVIKEGRRIMRNLGRVLDKAPDTRKTILEAEESVRIYKDKIRKYLERKETWAQNRKFEVKRGRFYRDLAGDGGFQHDVPKEEVVDFWKSMWNVREDEEEDFNEYLLEYVPEEAVPKEVFPSFEEFQEIVKFRPSWKAAGIDGIYNFFIKKLTEAHEDLYRVVKKMSLNGEEQEEWFYTGVTYLVPKGVPEKGSDFRPITCMSNLYKLTTKCATQVLQITVEERGLLADNQLGTVRRVQGAKEQALLNAAINRRYGNQVKVAWVDVQKAYDSVSHKYLLECLRKLNIAPWIAKLVEQSTRRWKLEIKSNGETVLHKKVERGILQGDSLSPMLFVLCMDPLSRRLNGIYPMLKVPGENNAHLTNHLLFVDDLKLLAKSEEVVEKMVQETEGFFAKVGLKMNKAKSATNVQACSEQARLLEGTEGYKYLGLLEDKDGRIKPENWTRIVEGIKDRVTRLCKTKLNARNLMKAINEHAISLLNYYTGLIEVEPAAYKALDGAIRSILGRHNLHSQPGCKERLYLPRQEIGRGLACCEHRSEQMLLQLKLALTEARMLDTRKDAILKEEEAASTHLATIETFIKAKYQIKEMLTPKVLREAQKTALYSEIDKKIYHQKLYRVRHDPITDMLGSSMWLRYGRMSPREEAALCYVQDRNMFFNNTEGEGKCPHCNEKKKSVDHLATQCDRMLAHDYMRRHNEVLRCIHLQVERNYDLTKETRIRNHVVQPIRSNDKVEIVVDKRVQTGIQVKYNKPDIFIVDKVKREIVIIEVGITSFDNLRAVEVEKAHKYDLLANHAGSLHGYMKKRIIPYVMTWDGVVTKHHRRYMQEIGIDNRTEAYIQSRVLKMTLESISFDFRRGFHDEDAGGDAPEVAPAREVQIPLAVVPVV
jgi:hypothetical protein